MTASDAATVPQPRSYDIIPHVCRFSFPLLFHLSILLLFTVIFPCLLPSFPLSIYFPCLSTSLSLLPLFPPFPSSSTSITSFLPLLSYLLDRLWLSTLMAFTLWLLPVACAGCLWVVRMAWWRNMTFLPLWMGRPSCLRWWCKECQIQWQRYIYAYIHWDKSVIIHVWYYV